MAAVRRRAKSYASREDWPDELMRAEKRAIEMAHCGDPDNHLAGYDYHKEDDAGDVHFYSGRAVLSCCAQPLCLTAIERKRTKLRKRAMEAFEAYTFQLGERYYFLTLTNTKMPELTRIEAIRLQNAAFRRWQDSVFYIRNIRGGVRSVETTTKPAQRCKEACCNSDKVVSLSGSSHAPGFHCHSHLPVVLSAEASEAIKQDFKAWRAQLKDSWTRAFQAECEKRGYEPPPADTYDGLYICHARPLTSKNPDSRSPIRDGLLEGLKYSLKPATIKHILQSESRLLEIAGTRQTVREGELFGCIRAAAPTRRTVNSRLKRQAAALGVLLTKLPKVHPGVSRTVLSYFLDTGGANAELASLADRPGFAANVRQPIALSPVDADEKYDRARALEARVLALRGLPEELEDELRDGREVNEAALEGLLDQFGRGFAAREIWEGRRDYMLAMGDEIRSARAVERIGGSGATREAIEREKRREAGDDYLKRRQRISRIERDLRLSRAEYERNAFYDWTQRQGAAMWRLIHRYPVVRFVTVGGGSFQGVLRGDPGAWLELERLRQGRERAAAAA